LPARVTAALVNDTVNKRILLDVASFDVPVWTGAVSGDWDATDGIVTGTPNWKELNSGNTTSYLQGEAGTDSVIFDGSSEEGQMLIKWAFKPKVLGYLPNVRGVITGIPEKMSPRQLRVRIKSPESAVVLRPKRW